MNTPGMSASFFYSGVTGVVQPAERPVTNSWYAAYTSARHEKSVVAKLADRGVSCYLPLFEAKHKWGGRPVTVQLPLFANYVFVRITPRERVRVLEAPGVLYIVGSKTEPSAIPDEVVQDLRNAIESGMRVSPHAQLSIGQNVRITKGPFRGREGILVRTKDSLRVVVSVQAITQSFSVEVDFRDLQVISG
jgi:transcriptional antiterminator RfaH